MTFKKEGGRDSQTEQGPSRSVPEAAAYAGIGKTTMWRAVYAREVETIRIGRRVLISQKALDDWLAKQTIPATK
ncbi:MAG: helix-turn-helix domain-containing protein [Cyanobacteria bacterium SZAS LIN-3]|nr:helix-turn-helix domain-containing protein [Cyanobacteria bacterium SZAS LIN-3]